MSLQPDWTGSVKVAEQDQRVRALPASCRRHLSSPLLSPLSPTKTNQLLLEPAGASGRPGGLQGTAGCRPETTLTLHCGTTDYNTPLAWLVATQYTHHF